MILEIDMGNSRLKWRLKTPSTRLAAGHLPAEANFEVLGEILGRYTGAVSRVLVASVRRAEYEQSFAAWARASLSVEPEFARSASACGSVINGYTNPGQLGVDRWLAIVAGYEYFRNSCVVVSAGTALTVDLIARDGRHLGGYIAPGFSLFMAALDQSTARINLGGDLVDVLDLAPGTATSTAVSNACSAMVRGIIDNALAHIRVVDTCEHAGLLLTGGDAERLQGFYPWADYKQELVLDGLSYAFGLRPIKQAVK